MRALLVIVCFFIVGASASFAQEASVATPQKGAAEKKSSHSSAGEEPTAAQMETTVSQLKQPLYSAFIERYVLDELKQLRTDMANQRVELLQQVVDRHVESVDKGVTYATNTITYFFYLIAGVSSLLVVVGWTSIREIKEKMRNLADTEIGKLINTYEARLREIEHQLSQKTQHIDENREEIEKTQGLHSLWLRAAQENAPANKLPIYDQILQLKPGDCEAITYKADAVLELGEPQWAINLCRQALEIESENAHAFYQLACAYTCLNQFDDALYYLRETLSRAETYRDAILTDPALAPLHDHPDFMGLSVHRQEGQSA